MKLHVEIFQRTVKDRKSGISYDLLHSWKQGIETQGDQTTLITQAVNPQIVDGEMDASTPVSVIFGYGGDTQTGHTKGRRRLVRKFQERMGGVTINFDGGVFNAFGKEPWPYAKYKRDGLPNHAVIWGILRGSDLMYREAVAKQKTFYYVDHAYIDLSLIHI